MASKSLISMGYPVSSPSILTRLWQEAMVCTNTLSVGRTLDRYVMSSCSVWPETSFRH